MKTSFAVLFVGLFVTLCLSAVPAAVAPHPTSMTCPFASGALTMSLPDCDVADPVDKKICQSCWNLCMFQYADLFDELIDPCFTTCIYEWYAILYVGSGPLSREIPDKRDAVLLDDVSLSHVRIQTPRS